MNKKLVCISVFMIFGLFIISGCEEVNERIKGKQIINPTYEENIYIDSNGDRVKIHFIDKAGNSADPDVFYTYSPTYPEIKLGEYYNEPLVIEEGKRLYVSDFLGYYYELGDLEPHFLYYYGGYSYEISIYHVYEDVNEVMFKNKNTGETYVEEYNEDGAPNTYNFLGQPFTIAFNEEEGWFEFIEFNDQEYGISNIETKRGVKIYLDDVEDKLTIEETDGKRIIIPLIYDMVPQSFRMLYLMSDGNSEFEIHPVEFLEGEPIVFKGITKDGAIIDWTELAIGSFLEQTINFKYL